MIDARGIAPCGEAETRFISRLASLCDELPRADFNDGNWIDHWTYVPDLIDAYVRAFPEREHEFVFDTPLRYCVVRPLCAKLRMSEAGPRQYDAVEVMLPRTDSSWERDSSGQLLISSLFSKLFLLCVLKCATLDPEQRGIELEAGKPGWNDALNGLPGLFGSSVSECVDLLLLIPTPDRPVHGCGQTQRYPRFHPDYRCIASSPARRNSPSQSYPKPPPESCFWP